MVITSANTPGLSGQKIREIHDAESETDDIRRMAWSVPVVPLDPLTDTDDTRDARVRKYYD